MVLCKYFQQGYCRFGTKCNNEHFDVKQIVKTDVESALNGNQWPLSCFGPFKDKPCIPNFIEDQSFEEIRFLCYEAKQKNFFEQFNQQFTKEVLDAKNKMKALLQLTPDIVDVVSQVYDTPTDGAAGGTTKTNNPFGVMPANGTTASSIFGKAATAANTNNVFGGSNSIFATAPATTNVFGTQPNQTAAAPPAFGQQTSIFGQQAKPTNSIFGGGTQQTTFGQVLPNTAASTGGGIFAQALKPQATVAQSGLFSQAAQQQQPTQQPGFGIFAQAAQQTAPAFQQQNPFGQQQQQQQTGIFAQALQQPVQNGNIFGQQQQQLQQQQQQSSIFTAAVGQQQNIFAQQQQPLQQPSNNIFAQAVQQTQPSAGGFFQQPPQQQQQQQPQSTFAQQPNLAASPAPALQVASASIYSRMEDLTPDEIEAFKADSFSAGKIPFSPPPRELIN